MKRVLFFAVFWFFSVGAYSATGYMLDTPVTGFNGRLFESKEALYAELRAVGCIQLAGSWVKYTGSSKYFYSKTYEDGSCSGGFGGQNRKLSGHEQPGAFYCASNEVQNLISDATKSCQSEAAAAGASTSHLDVRCTDIPQSLKTTCEYEPDQKDFCGSSDAKSQVDSARMSCSLAANGGQTKFSYECDEENDRIIPECIAEHPDCTSGAGVINSSGDLVRCIDPVVPPDPPSGGGDKPSGGDGDKPSGGGDTGSGGEDPTGGDGDKPDPNKPTDLKPVVLKLDKLDKNQLKILEKLNASNQRLGDINTSINTLDKNNTDNANKILAANQENADKLLAANKEGMAKIADINKDGFDRLNRTNKDGLDKLAKATTGGFNNVDGRLEDIQGTLDRIAGTHLDTDGFGNCYKKGTCKGFYESKYPDGLDSVVSGFVEEFKTDPVFDVIDNMTTLNLSGASAPSFTMCLNFGAFGHFGCGNLFSDFGYIWSFIRFCVVFTALASSRKIVFGG